MLQNVFSHRPPLYELFDKAEFRALHTLCEGQLDRRYKVPMVTCAIRYDRVGRYAEDRR